MADLIDRDALMKKICGNECGCVCDEECENAMCNFYDYIMDAPAVNRFISVEDALPEKSGEYLVYTEYEDVFKCYFEKENDPEEDECQWGFYQDYRDPDTLGLAGTTWTAVETVTHWMQLPEPPKEGASDD